LKIRKVEGYTNYDKSEFESSAPLSQDDDDLEKIWKSEYALSEFLSETNFKSYDELKARLNKVLGIDSGDTVAVAKPNPPATPKAESKPKATVESAKPWADDEDDDVSYFEKLAED
jgi:hypothetical protein